MRLTLAAVEDGGCSPCPKTQRRPSVLAIGRSLSSIAESSDSLLGRVVESSPAVDGGGRDGRSDSVELPGMIVALKSVACGGEKCASAALHYVAFS